MHLTRLVRRLPRRLMTWLKWTFAGAELRELHQLKTGMRQATRTLGVDFPDVVNAIGYLELAANGTPCDIEKLKARMLARRADRLAAAIAYARRDDRAALRHALEAMNDSGHANPRRRRSYDREPVQPSYEHLGDGCNL
jgi:hypothetical protein